MLDGVWFKDCTEEDPGDPETLYETVELTFARGAIESDIRVYEDSSCLMAFSAAPNPQAKGSFLIGRSFTSGDGLEVRELDLHVTEFSGAPFDLRSYTIFYIDGDELFFGEDAEVAAERPTELNFSEVFVKQ